MSKIIKKEKRGVIQRSENVCVSNAIIQAGHNLNLAEKRIVTYAIALFCSQENHSMKSIIIDAADYAKIFEIPVKQAYEQIKIASKSLLKKIITFRSQDIRGHWATLHFLWTQSCFYRDTFGEVSITFSDILYENLIDLKQHFTQYRLNQVARLKSCYSWRLLELFEKHMPYGKTNGWMSIQLEDFWIAMDATKSHKSDFGATRRKIIEPAMQEIIEKNKWKIKVEYRKTGRKITSMYFNFSKPGLAKLENKLPITCQEIPQKTQKHEQEHVENEQKHEQAMDQAMAQREKLLAEHMQRQERQKQKENENKEILKKMFNDLNQLTTMR